MIVTHFAGPSWQARDGSTVVGTLVNKATVEHRRSPDLRALPQRIIIGGGVANQPTLLPRVRRHAQEVASGYFDAPALAEEIDDYIVPAALDDRAGVLGAIELARLSIGANDVPPTEASS